ncbi:Vigilin [Thelohanellus kitauei]|uniref:Vigilin n=1 Tax=Thelohanellus kitauei TaxID=669202 RepID=A0A0C2ITC9_THEKT|nr:Vigilin [Thelohanellus kitauei]
MTKSDDIKIIFSSNCKKDEEEYILVIGHSDSVVQTIKSINEAITYLQNCLQKTIMIKADMKGDFLKKLGGCDSLVVQISRKYNVSIHIDEKLQENNCYRMKVFGCKKEVDEATQYINNMISTLQERIEAKLNIPMPTFSYVDRNLRQLLRETEAKLNVALSVSRNVFDALKTGKFEGNCEITIKGKHSDVAAAKDALKEWRIESVHHPLPNCVQRYLFSHRSPKLNHLVHRIRVDVDLGCQRNPPADFIIITGLNPAVDRAIKYIEDVSESDFKVQLQVDPKYYRRLIGKGGSSIKDFNLHNNVEVLIPKPTQGDVISIFGSKTNCLRALEKIKALVSIWETTVEKEFEIDSSINSKFCGPQNGRLRETAKRFDVHVSDPRVVDFSDSKRIIIVSGLKDNVEQFINYLKAEINSFLNPIEDEYNYYIIPQNKIEIKIGEISVGSPVSQKKTKKNLVTSSRSSLLHEKY